MQNLRHPQRGSADLGDRKSPFKYGEFRRNSTDYRLVSKSSERGTFFFLPRAFSISSNVTAPFFHFFGYIPYVPVKGSLKIPSSGVRKVNTAKARAIAQRIAIAHLGEGKRVFFARNSRAS